MPNYDYQCLDCQEQFEKSHGIYDLTQVFCPVCNSQNTRKAITGFYLKSSGKNVGQAEIEEMKADLRENYKIESVNMRQGSFKDWYAGVKADGARVKEQMIAGEEANQKKASKKQREFMSKPINLSNIKPQTTTKRLPPKKH